MKQAKKWIQQRNQVKSYFSNKKDSDEMLGHSVFGARAQHPNAATQATGRQIADITGVSSPEKHRLHALQT
ncbi:hypothetical protein [Halopseudomonas laoshanensis]|uniref:hypothetical protein n=1 Tax=Halopseudomonas laoshanensis TaxID=2268758 RepID=UPI0011ECB740|nr:hypothetical protein [Halopseudomonas laoshanensis]